MRTAPVEDDEAVVDTAFEPVIALAARCVEYTMLPGVDVGSPTYGVALDASLHIGRIANEAAVHFACFHTNYFVGGRQSEVAPMVVHRGYDLRSPFSVERDDGVLGDG